MPEPFQYDHLEDEIVTRLTASISTVASVSSLPESDASIKDAIDSALDQNKTMVLVAYTGSEFGPSGSTNVIRQEEGINILLNLQSNKLRGENGIYNVIRLIKDSLLGYLTSNGGRLKLKSIDFDNRDELSALFSYNVVFTVTKLQMQKLKDGDDDITQAVNLVKTNFQNAEP